jgi:hypothetical protein
MKTIITSLALFLTLHLQAIELNYNWQQGAAYAYSGTVTDNVKTSMMGMNMSDKFTTTVDFVLAVQSVNSEGTATGVLFITNFSVVDSKGVKLASLSNLPQNAVRSEVKVDKKGNFEFLRKIYLLTTPTSNCLVYGKVSENGGMAGAQTENERVEVYAEFDPKTGNIKAGYNVQQLQPKPVAVKTNEESDQIDVIPYDLLQFLVLPEGDVNLNDRAKVQAGLYTTEIFVKSLTPAAVTLDQTISTNKKGDMFAGGASGQKGDGSGGFDMEFGGAQEMELDHEDQMAIGMTQASMPSITGNISSSFNPSIGQFSTAKGTLTTSMDMMGAKIEVVSNFNFTRK